MDVRGSVFMCVFVNLGLRTNKPISKFEVKNFVEREFACSSTN